MNSTLKQLLSAKNAPIPENLNKFAESTNIDLIKLKKIEKEYLELLRSRLAELKQIASICDPASKELSENEINTNAKYYLFRHQSGTFRHKNTTDLVKEYTPLINK